MVGVQLPDGASLERTPGDARPGQRRSPATTPGVEQVIAIAGISVLDNSADAGQRRRRLRHPRRTGACAERRRARTCARSSTHIQAALDGLQDGAGFVLRAAADPGHRQRRRLQPCRSSSATAASITRKLQSIDADRRRAGARASPLCNTSSPPSAPACRNCTCSSRPLQGGDAESLGGRRVRHALRLSRVDLRQPVQQVRPHACRSTCRRIRSIARSPRTS